MARTNQKCPACYSEIEQTEDGKCFLCLLTLNEIESGWRIGMGIRNRCYACGDSVGLCGFSMMLSLPKGSVPVYLCMECSPDKDEHIYLCVECNPDKRAPKPEPITAAEGEDLLPRWSREQGKAMVREAIAEADAIWNPDGTPRGPRNIKPKCECGSPDGIHWQFCPAFERP